CTYLPLRIHPAAPHQETNAKTPRRKGAKHLSVHCVFAPWRLCVCLPVAERGSGVKNAQHPKACGKGVWSQKCAAPEGPFRFLNPDPLSARHRWTFNQPRAARMAAWTAHVPTAPHQETNAK